MNCLIPYRVLWKKQERTWRSLYPTYIKDTIEPSSNSWFTEIESTRSLFGLQAIYTFYPKFFSLKCELNCILCVFFFSSFKYFKKNQLQKNILSKQFSSWIDSFFPDILKIFLYKSWGALRKNVHTTWTIKDFNWSIYIIVELLDKLSRLSDQFIVSYWATIKFEMNF